MRMKKQILALLVIFFLALGAAEINFRSDQEIDFYNNLNMRGNSILQFFGNCGKNEAVANISADGSFDCVPSIEAGLPGVLDQNNSANQNIDMNSYNLTNLGGVKLGWKNLTDYPAGCAGDEAVQIVDDSITCVSLNPGGTVEVESASKGEVAYFIDSSNISGASNLFWNSSQTRLGIGTTNPSTMLEVTGTMTMGGPIKNIGSGNIDIGDGSGNIEMNGERLTNASLIQAGGLGVTDSEVTAANEIDGNDLYVQQDVKVDGDIIGGGADVAERIMNESTASPGTVVEISGNMTVEKSEKRFDTDVAGVVSTDPAMVMAKERGGVPVAMTGTAEVKVTMEEGRIMPGDMLTTASRNGFAMKCPNLERCEGAIIGKAMEPAKEAGKIKMLVSRG